MKPVYLLAVTLWMTQPTGISAIEPAKLIPENFSSIPQGDRIFTHLEKNGKTLGVVTVIGHISASPDRVYAALTNPELTNELFPKLKENKLKYRKGPLYYYHSVLDFPWPVQDRWSLNETRFYPDIRGLRWKRTDGSIKVNEGAWRLFPSEVGTLMIYQVRFDPGLAMIPDWLLNYGMEKEAPGIIHSLRKFFKK
ncbi:MAG: hypothetical protein RH862_16865 [Leptospiraceae bacterium]